MMFSALRTLAFTAIPLVAIPAFAAPAPAAPASPALSSTQAAAAAPVTVMRYTFNGGAPAGRVAENSGRGLPLTLRSADRGAARFVGTATSKYVTFPGSCARTAKTCARALLEAKDDADLDPGTRAFRWAATVRLTKAQVVGSSNVVQKGVSTTDSQWKLQIGAGHGRAQCVIVGRGDAKPYLARSTVSVADGGWHKVICRRSGTALTVFVDGVDRGHITVPAALSITNDLPLRIGGPNFNTTSDMYHGQLDDVSAILG
jgi:hypothetical protein